MLRCDVYLVSHSEKKIFSHDYNYRPRHKSKEELEKEKQLNSEKKKFNKDKKKQNKRRRYYGYY